MMSDKDNLAEKHGVVVRTTIKPGDTGLITYLHGRLYADEYSFDHTFETYVAIPLSEFVKAHTHRERIWIVEKQGEVMGSAALVRFSDQQAQLRWLLLHPAIRGLGIGKMLVGEAVNFARECGYASVFLLTINFLPRAAGIYSSYGFRITEETRTRMWGVDMVEQRYELKL